MKGIAEILGNISAPVDLTKILTTDEILKLHEFCFMVSRASVITVIAFVGFCF